MADDAPAPAPASTQTPTPTQRTEVKIVPDPAAPKRTAETDTEWAIDKLRARREDGMDIDPDIDGYVYPTGPDGRRDPNRPHYKNNDDAIQALKEKTEEDRRIDAEYERERQQYQENQHQERVRQAQTYSPQEVEIVQAGRQAAATLNLDAENFVKWQNSVVAGLPQLEQTNPSAAAALKQQIVQGARELLARNHALQQLDQVARQTLAMKPVQADKLRLEKLHPELADPEWKQRAVQWAMDTHGVTAQEVTNATDVGVVSRYVRAYKAHLENQKGDHFNAALARDCREHGVGWRDPPKNLEELRAYAKKHGDIASNTALRIWTKKAETARRQGRI